MSCIATKMKNFTIGSYRQFWSQLAIIMMSLYLLTDMLSGFSIIYLGLDIKASLIYKVPLLILILGLIARSNILQFNFLLFFIIITFIGPLYQFYKYARLDFFIVDFSSAIKILTPICIFFLYKEWYKNSPELALKSTHKILKYSFCILTINFIVGFLGFGKNTYSVGEDAGTGSTGLIMAGNELGGAFLVTFAYMLHMCWNYKSKKLYFLLACFTIACGVSVATKTAILSSFLIVFFIPIVNERGRLYKLTLLKVKLFTPLILIILFVFISIIEVLQSLGLYDRMMYIYNERGLLTMVLSGRNLMIADTLDIVTQNSNLFEQVFGQGQALSLKRLDGSAITEVDSFDTYVLYGIFCFIIVFSFYIYLVYKSNKQTVQNVNFFSPFIFLTSFILLLLSQLSGHIWGAGTVGILIGVMSGALYAKKE